MGAISAKTITLSNGDQAVIRSAVTSDAPALLRVDLEGALDDYFGPADPDEIDRSIRARKRRIREIASSAGRILLVAAVNGVAVGAIAGHPEGRYRRLQHTIMFGIVVARHHRKLGVGRALIASLLEWARARGTIEIVRLRVMSTNPDAQRLYRTLGFLEEARIVRAIRRRSGEYADDIWMRLDLLGTPNGVVR